MKLACCCLECRFSQTDHNHECKVNWWKSVHEGLSLLLVSIVCLYVKDCRQSFKRMTTGVLGSSSSATLNAKEGQIKRTQVHCTIFVLLWLLKYKILYFLKVSVFPQNWTLNQSMKWFMTNCEALRLYTLTSQGGDSWPAQLKLNVFFV